jgi:hypothetical protein
LAPEKLQDEFVRRDGAIYNHLFIILLWMQVQFLPKIILFQFMEKPDARYRILISLNYPEKCNGIVFAIGQNGFTHELFEAG